MRGFVFILAGVGIAVIIAAGLALLNPSGSTSEKMPSSVNSVVHSKAEPNGTDTLPTLGQ